MSPNPISSWVRYYQIIAVSTMFSGYPFVAALALLTGLPSTPLSVGVRALTAFASIGILLAVPVTQRSQLSRLLLVPITLFWVMLLIRMAVDTYYYYGLLLYDPYSYWIWGVGGSLIPLLGFSRMVYSDDIADQLFRWTFYLTLLAAVLIIPNIGTTVQNNTGEDVDTGRGLIQGLNPISLGHLGVQLVLMGIWQLFLQPKPKTIIHDWIFVVGIFIGTFLALAANSRGPLLAFVLVMMFSIAASKLKSKYVVLGMLIVGALAFIPLINVIDAISGTSIYARLFEQSQLTEVSTLGRVELYISAWNLFLQYPMLGAGLEDPTFGGYPHNVFIEAFMTTGIFGGTFMVFSLVMAIYVAFRLLRDLPLYAWIPLIALQHIISAQFSGTLVQSTTMWGAVGLMTSLATLLVFNVDRVRALAERQKMQNLRGNS